MQVIDPGHVYELDNLQSKTKTILKFMKDKDIHGGIGHDGPSCQEVIRAIIDRVQTMDLEMPWSGNRDIIHHARMMIAFFEARAIVRRVEKDCVAIEKIPVADDGHLLWSDK